MSFIYHSDKWNVIVSRTPKSTADLCDQLLSEFNYHIVRDPFQIWPDLPRAFVASRILTNSALPSGHWSSIVSSRLKHPLFDQTDWLTRLRSTIQQLQNTIVQVVRNTAGDNLVRAACEVYEKPWLDVSVIPSKPSLSSVFKVLTGDDSMAENRCCLGKLLVIADSESLTDQLPRVPIRDCWNFYTSNDVFVLNNSGKGNIQALIEHWPNKIHPVSIPPATVLDLPQWYKEGEYLSHFTRAIDGPCSNESQFVWHKKLVRLDPHSLHTAERVLFKIAYEQKLRASSATIRGGYKVVSFTSVPLFGWPQLTKFRSHKRRWDFAPYGICINQACLSKKVAKVRYGNEGTWQGLTESQRPYFQAKGKKIDWTVEQEYRHIGDLDLSTIPQESAIVFVATDADRDFIQPFSLWPVMLFDSLVNIPAVHPVL